MKTRFLAAAVFMLFTLSGRPAAAVDASDPQGVTLTCYDTGITLVNELRRIIVAPGDNAFRFRQVPAQLDPASVAILPAGGKGSVDIREQRLEYDLAGLSSLVQRYLGRPVTVRVGADRYDGVLRSITEDPTSPNGPRAAMLTQADGSVAAIPLGDPRTEIAFPGAAAEASLEPTLFMQASATEEGPQNVRLSYLTGGLDWRAQYEVMLAADQATAQLNCNVRIENQSGGAFNKARLRLVQTQKGQQSPLVPAPVDEAQWNAQPPAMRYPYGSDNPTLERAVAGVVPIQSFELQQALDLPRGAVKYAQLTRAPRVSVNRFYVYDGVRFDHFQRNPRTDWSYGTEYRTAVEMYLDFENTTQNGLGLGLPQGPIRLYQQQADGAVDLAGEGFFLATPTGGLGHVRMGPARGLKGERERTGYTEVKPLHEYEETFEIRLSNESPDTAVVRVVEHLYRWHDFEIVGADAEYKTTGAQTIEFSPELKAGGRRSIHYTVRYRW